MHIFVLVTRREAYYKDGGGIRQKLRLEQASGDRVLIVPHEEFSLKVVEELRPRSVIMSGFGQSFQDWPVESFSGMDEVLHRAELPVLAICGSHQLLGFSFNRNLRKVKRLWDQPMRKLTKYEPYPRDLYRPGYFVARGFFPIRQVKRDPLFDGLPKTMILCCSHYCEVKRLPRDFELLASSEHCRIEAMKHVTRPLYGIQFHAEAYEEPYLHGRRVLENFFTIVKDFWS